MHSSARAYDAHLYSGIPFLATGFVLEAQIDHTHILSRNDTVMSFIPISIRLLLLKKAEHQVMT